MKEEGSQDYNIKVSWFLNRYNEVNNEQYFKIRNDRSKKGNSRKLSINHGTEDVKKHFYNRFVDAWNKLREETVNVDNKKKSSKYCMILKKV